MEKSFNLLDKPWLPVRLTDGSVMDVGLLEVFRRSDEVAALAETAPPNLVAHHRLLLAILHRALTRAHPQGWKDKDRARWWREGFPVDDVIAYLEHWRERFWLFHPEHPFMQVAALATAEETRDKLKPWTQIALASATGNTPVVFDHARDDAPTSITPATALCALLGYLQFTPGGLVKVFRNSDKAGALANTAAAIPMGENLAQTLLLSLHPWQAHEDLPAWESSALDVPQLRAAAVLASGPNDRYTRQSRAVLLQREPDGQVRWLRFAAGFALEEGGAPDPMASFRQGSNGLVRLGFSEGRALWRDLAVLVPNPAGTSHPAAVLSYAAALQDELNPFDSTFQPLLVAGLASDKAKLERWRSERIALPLALLKDAGKALYLRNLVEKAETLLKDIKVLATRMLAETMPEPEHKETKARARSLLDAGPLATSYFAQAERHLPQVLQELGKGQFELAHESWNQALRESAMNAWQQLLKSMGAGARVLRADAKYTGVFHAILRKHAPKSETISTHKEEQA